MIANVRRRARWSAMVMVFSWHGRLAHVVRRASGSRGYSGCAASCTGEAPMPRKASRILGPLRLSRAAGVFVDDVVEVRLRGLGRRDDRLDVRLLELPLVDWRGG